jgi:hypothetical protein
VRDREATAAGCDDERALVAARIEKIAEPREPTVLAYRRAAAIAGAPPASTAFPSSSAIAAGSTGPLTPMTAVALSSILVALPRTLPMASWTTDSGNPAAMAVGPQKALVACLCWACAGAIGPATLGRHGACAQ